MVNVTSLTAFRASLAQSAGAENRFSASCPPANAIGAGNTASPPRMGLASSELRLPLSHAPVAAERLFAVEVALRPGNVLAAPFARTSLTTRPRRVRAPSLCPLGAFPRALFLASLSGSGGGLSALGTEAFRWFAPAGPERALVGAPSRIGPSVLRVVGRLARLTRTRLGELSHVGILSDEEKWCEVAAKRLAQGVLL